MRVLDNGTVVTDEVGAIAGTDAAGDVLRVGDIVVRAVHPNGPRLTVVSGCYHPDCGQWITCEDDEGNNWSGTDAKAWLAAD